MIIRCRFCRREFDTARQRKDHERTAHPKPVKKGVHLHVEAHIHKGETVEGKTGPAPELNSIAGRLPYRGAGQMSAQHIRTAAQRYNCGYGAASMDSCFRAEITDLRARIAELEADLGLARLALEQKAATLASADAALAARQPVEAEPVAADLAVLVRRLVRRLEKECPGTDLAPWALDYLRRKGLHGTPLRAAQQPATVMAEVADERATFEAWFGRPLFNPDAPSHYNGRDARKAWEAWQARALLAQQGAQEGAVDAARSLLDVIDRSQGPVVAIAQDSPPVRILREALKGKPAATPPAGEAREGGAI